MRKIVLVFISLIVFQMCGKGNNDNKENTSSEIKKGKKYSVTVVKESIIEQKGPFPKFRGARLMWNKGTSPVAVNGDTIYAIVPKQSIKVKPLCNRKWVIYKKLFGADKWIQTVEGEKYNEREPFPLGMLGSHPIFSVNPAFKFRKVRSDGYIASYTKPALVVINNDKKETIIPQWDNDYKFFEHAYRGFAVDGKNRRIFIAQQVPLGNDEYGQSWSIVDRKGKTLNNGLFRFPDRGCYPILSINGKQAYGIFDSDIKEPNEEFHQLKKKITGQNWDYVFQYLYLLHSDDVLNGKFSKIYTLDSCASTAGYIRALDLWNLPNGDAFALYIKTSTSCPYIRDRYFKGKPIEISLMYAHIKDGKVIDKKVLVKADDNLKTWDDYNISKPNAGDVFPDVWTKTPKPLWGHFYSPDGEQLFLIWNQKDFKGKETGNYIKRIFPTMGQSIRIPLKHELMEFSLPSSNNGCSTSNKIILYGTKSYEDKSPYCAEIELIIE